MRSSLFTPILCITGLVASFVVGCGNNLADPQAGTPIPSVGGDSNQPDDSVSADEGPIVAQSEEPLDSDGDGYSDSEEIDSAPGTDPWDPSDNPANVRDSDGDGCSNVSAHHDHS